MSRQSFRGAIQPWAALVAILAASAGLAVPRDTGGPMSVEGFRQALLEILGLWGWMGVVLVRLETRSPSAIWAFRLGLVASVGVSLPNALAAPSDCQACFRAPEPADYGGAAFGIALLWISVVALERERETWSAERRVQFEQRLRWASHGWFGLAGLALSAGLLRFL